mmetsp:Transcript_69206/g.218958  ORF Transcript_69206/g.218958 Transcript_69206/m.218958 type:complete len:266 (+) Transcript_69206:156-953(+)
MADAPLLPARIVEQLGAAHVKDPPPHPPLGRVHLAVRLGKDALDRGLVRILAREPVVAGAAVVLAVDPPMALDAKVVLEVQEEVVRGHGASREEVLGHPIVLAFDFEVIRVLHVREDVDEHEAAGPQPPGAPLEQLLVILHVLEHLDGHHAIEGTGGGARAVANAPEHRHVRGDDLEVGDAPLFAAIVDELLLGAAVGDGGDAAPRVALGHEHGEGPPPAPKLQDVLPVLELRPLAVEAQHGLLRLLQGRLGGLIQAARVLEIFP